VRNRVYRLIVAIGGGFFRVLSLRRTVLGTHHVPARGGAVLAISHFSYLDFALVEWALWRDRRRYTRFLATEASFRHPLAGPLMRSMGHIPVLREAGGHAYRHAVAALERGEVVGVFPETRVSSSFTLLPFKTGAVRMAQQAAVPVVPCVVWGSHRVMTRSHPTRLWRARRTPVVIVFGEPVLVGPGEESDEVTRTLHEQMERLLTQAQDEYPEVPPPGAWWVPAHRGGGAPAPQTQERTA
jgi:1-acyl-sn-glycerol-3-phosphate acyltransferase